MPKAIDLTGDYNTPTSPVSPDVGDGPRVFLDNPAVLDLPDEGTITFRFKRGPITIREPHRGQSGSASADLCLCQLLSWTEEEPADDGDEDNETSPAGRDRIDELFEEAREAEQAGKE